MTEQTPPQPRQTPQPRPEQPEQPERSSRPRHTSESSSATPEVFGDGSTKAQQDQLVKEAEEANAQTKELADAQRDARED